MTGTSDERERRAKQSPTHRVTAALATYLLVSGASIYLMFRLCERCSGDNAYLGELFLAMVVVFLGLCLGLVWLIGSRREALRGLAAGAIPGLGVGAVIVVVGATRTLVPMALSLVVLLLLIVGFAGTVAFASRKT